METTAAWESRKRNREDDVDDDQDDTKRAATDILNSNEEKVQVKSSTDVPTASQFIIPADQFLSLPPELQDVDFTKRVSWRKFSPYTKEVLPLTPEGQEPEFKEDSPALCFHVHATSGRARATTLHLPSSRKVQTPIFMPVG